MLDLVEVLDLERVERQILADRQGLLARGVPYKDLPSVWDAQQRWHDAITAGPGVMDLQEFRRRKAIGLMAAGGRG